MYILHTLPSRFLVDIDSASPAAQSLSDAEKQQQLCIERATGLCSVTPQRQPIDASAISERIDSIVGTIQLLRGRYLIVCTATKSSGTLNQHAVKQLTKYKVLSYTGEKRHDTHTVLTPQQEEDEKHYLALLDEMLRVGTFYYSREYDLTLTTQRIAEMQAAQSQSTDTQYQHQRADPRFWWNAFLSSDLLQGNAHSFITTYINGYFYTQTLTLNARQTQFILVSRKSVFRSGKRLLLRGADLQGQVANFAETEQIVYTMGSSSAANHDAASSNSSSGDDLTRVSSYVQTRGSIPLLWTQTPTCKYTPKIQLISGAESLLAFRRHMEQHFASYQRTVCISLINQKGAELKLVHEFTHAMKTSGVPEHQVRLVNWDFHAETKGMKYENIGRLIAELKDEFDAMNYFSATLVSSSNSNSNNSGNGARQQFQIQHKQNGAMRVNCIDCLDRTNVVQSVFAKYVLCQQLLAHCNYTHTPPNLDLKTAVPSVASRLEQMFRHVWANNADAMSLQYSGTGALKTDYTRTGKRSKKGACMDGWNSVNRYVMNNFRDGRTQDAYDLFLGVYVPSRDKPSPFDVSSQPALQQRPFAPAAIAFTAAMFATVSLLSLVLPSSLTPYRRWPASLQALLFTLVTLFVGTRLLVKFGREFTSKPLLRNALTKDM